MAALASLSPRGQAKVLRGVIERFPPDEVGAPSSRPATHAQLLAYIKRLESGPLIASQTPQITSEVVLRAPTDAENLIQSSGPTSAVDRVHTVLHGFLIAVCEGAGIAYGERQTMVAVRGPPPQAGSRTSEAHQSRSPCSGHQDRPELQRQHP